MLDIGMNIGNHTCFFAAHGIKVIGFEPNPKIFAIAQENVKINHFEERVKIFPYGISSHSHKATMSKENPRNFGSMRLIEDENASIECKSIDSFEFKEKIVLMKIDVEGMELEVLKGAKQSLLKDKPLIYFEANDYAHLPPIKKYLENLGYIYENLLGDFGAWMHVFVYKDKADKELLRINSYTNSSLAYFNTLLQSRYLWRKVKQLRILICITLGFAFINLLLGIVFFIFLFFKT